MVAKWPRHSPNYEDLLNDREHFRDHILVAVDFECVDHVGNALSEGDKVSEVGLAWFDPRAENPTWNLETTYTGKPPEYYVGKAIHVRHCVIDTWKTFTPKTCPASFHKDGHRSQKSHTSAPYNAYFHQTDIFAKDVAITKMKTVFSDLIKSKRTSDEIAEGTHRSLLFLFWDARLENKVFAEWGIWNHIDNIRDLNGNTIQIDILDLQRWGPIKKKWSHYSQAPARLAFPACGLHFPDDYNDQPIVFHNASNDAWAEIMVFIRLIRLPNEEAYKDWMSHSGGLDLVDLSWTTGTIYEANVKLGKKMENEYLKALN
ncbi:hypothetical protein B0T17DRAFT_507432 [Bombardia bombarda]|uniref:Uncharacterized protein n=1 Tax=Bombardia bombarda TaxID=252184 RepID=A0AA39XBR1_9PEZI|nr:hypothetical protein B0T17DRAFT_507432 [Bombardia bombarda]